MGCWCFSWGIYIYLKKVLFQVSAPADYELGRSFILFVERCNATNAIEATNDSDK